ncbi:hypothetical protein HU200_049438 [Digitaria exilis]|uniref:Uncharacterized protein n=1 Tax=Digitaria exilis TaxID=1010633 RepID=A0A835AQT5_9POAL|nr:hypothetical protein HU200_049438 [Digitaria exilis]
MFGSTIWELCDYPYPSRQGRDLSAMAERLEAAPAAGDEYTQDGTVDLHGNPVLRSKRGGWKACGFVVGTD